MWGQQADSDTEEQSFEGLLHSQGRSTQEMISLSTRFGVWCDGWNCRSHFVMKLRVKRTPKLAEKRDGKQPRRLRMSLSYRISQPEAFLNPDTIIM